MRKRANLIVVANNGTQVQFFDITQLSSESLDKAKAEFDESETRLYDAAKKDGGFTPGQILAIIAGRKNVFRAYELVSAI